MSNVSFFNHPSGIQACNSTDECSGPQNQTNILTPNIVYFPTSFLVGFHCAYAILLLVGILGNILTCYVIVQRKSMRRAIHMYTFNLAVADLLILSVYVPNQMLVIEEQFKWPLGRSVCKISYMILPVALHASVGTLLAITIDRCRGLVSPFSWRADSLNKAKISLPIIWFVSLVLSSPLFEYSDLIEMPGGAYYCGEAWPSKVYSKWFWTSNFIIVFAIPLVVIVTTQIVMIVAVARETSNKKQNQRMVVMVISLVVVFTVCTGFQHLYFFITEFARLEMKLSTRVLLFALSNYVVSLQAAINPIVYGTLRRDFKKAFTHSLVILLIKLKLHKGVLLDHQNKYSLANKVLTSYFSESHSRKHTDEDVKQVEDMFKKKKLENERAARESFYSCFDSPQIGERRNFVRHSSLISGKRIVLEDSPRIRRNFSGDSPLIGDGGSLLADSPRIKGRHLIKSLGGCNNNGIDSPCTNKRFYGNNLSPEHALNGYSHRVNESQIHEGSLRIENVHQAKSRDSKEIPEELSQPTKQLSRVCDSSSEEDLNYSDSPRVSRDLSLEAVDSNKTTTITTTTFTSTRKLSIISIGSNRLRKDSVFSNDQDNKPDGVQLLSYKDIRASIIPEEHKLPENEQALSCKDTRTPVVVQHVSRSPALRMVHKNLAEKYSNNLCSVSDTGYVSGSDEDGDDDEITGKSYYGQSKI